MCRRRLLSATVVVSVGHLRPVVRRLIAAKVKVSSHEYVPLAKKERGTNIEQLPTQSGLPEAQVRALQQHEHPVVHRGWSTL